MTRLENLKELEKYLVKVKMLGAIADIDFGEHFEAIYTKWRLEYGRELRKNYDRK